MWSEDYFFLGIQNVMKICADIQSGALEWEWLKSKHSVLHVLETYSSKTQELSDFVQKQTTQLEAWLRVITCYLFHKPHLTFQLTVVFSKIYFGEFGELAGKDV